VICCVGVETYASVSSGVSVLCSAVEASVADAVLAEKEAFSKVLGSSTVEKASTTGGGEGGNKAGMLKVDT